MNEFEDYVKSIKNINRFFVDEKYLSYFDNFINNNKVKLKKGTLTYRSRINKPEQVNEPFSDIEIGMPAISVNTSVGRSNPKGIRYYYLSSDEQTSISEIRASIDDFITVATVEITDDLILVEMGYIVSISSEIVEPEKEIMNVMKFMLNMERGFSKPIKGEREIEYAPYQYFAEYCKKQGVDGIKFYSSVMPNPHNSWGEFSPDNRHYNYVLFNDSKTKISNKKVVKLTRIEYGYDEFESD